jgi:hypothetical protein
VGDRSSYRQIIRLGYWPGYLTRLLAVGLSDRVIDRLSNQVIRSDCHPDSQTDWWFKQIVIKKINRNDRVDGITRGRCGRGSNKEQNQMRQVRYLDRVGLTGQ